MGSWDPSRRDEKNVGGLQYRGENANYVIESFRLSGIVEHVKSGVANSACALRGCSPLQGSAGNALTFLPVRRSHGQRLRSPLPRHDPAGVDNAWPKHGSPSSGHVSARTGCGDEAKSLKSLNKKPKGVKVNAKSTLEVRQLFAALHHANSESLSEKGRQRRAAEMVRHASAEEVDRIPSHENQSARLNAQRAHSKQEVDAARTFVLSREALIVSLVGQTCDHAVEQRRCYPRGQRLC